MKNKEKYRREMLAYKVRDELLRTMGYASYRIYLESELWKLIRTAVLDRDDHRCRGCGKLAKQVHHQTYGLKTLQGENLRSLRALCARCHHEIEFDKYGKTSPKRAKRRLKRRLRWSTEKALQAENLQYCALNSHLAALKKTLKSPERRASIIAVRRQLRNIVRQKTREILEPPVAAPAHIASSG